MTVEQLHDALTLLPADLVAAADKRRSRKPKVIQWQRWAAMAACFAIILCAGSFCMLILTPMGTSSDKAAPEVMEMAAAPEEMAAPQAVETYAAAEDAPAAEAPAMTQERNTVTSGSGIEGWDCPGEQEAQESGRMNGGTTLPQETSLTAGDWAATLAPGFVAAQWLETPYGDTVYVASTPHVTLAASAEELGYYMNRRDFQDMSALQDIAALREEGWFELYDLILVRLPWTEPALLDIQETEAGWNIVLPQQNPEQSGSYHLLLTVEKGLVPDADAITLSFE